MSPMLPCTPCLSPCDTRLTRHATAFVPGVTSWSRMAPYGFFDKPPLPSLLLQQTLRAPLLYQRLGPDSTCRRACAA